MQSLVFYSFRACINQTLSLSPRRTLSYWKAARYEELLRAHKQTNGVKARTWHRVEARAVLRAACGLLWRSANGDGAKPKADAAAAPSTMPMIWNFEKKITSACALIGRAMRCTRTRTARSRCASVEKIHSGRIGYCLARAVTVCGIPALSSLASLELVSRFP